MSERELFLRRFHAAHPGITARAFARGGSYARLAALVSSAGMSRVLDLGCGDGALARLVGPHCIGLDLSHEELRLGAAGRAVQGRAQALPFADASFDVVACHLAFMLFDEVERVVGELARVLRPGGTFLALLGGGPTAHGDDAFHRFVSLLGPSAAPRLGDPRARTEAGWRALFGAPWELAPFERWELDLGGNVAEVWAFLAASYELVPARAAAIEHALRTAFPDERVPCRVVTYLARAIRR